MAIAVIYIRGATYRYKFSTEEAPYKCSMCGGSPLRCVLAVESHGGQVVRSLSLPQRHDSRHVFTQNGDGCQLTDEVEMGGHYGMDGTLVCDG